MGRLPEPVGSAEVREVEQFLRPRRRLQETQQLAGRGILGGGTQLLEPCSELRIAGRLELQGQPGRAQGLVHAGEHPPQAPATVRSEQPQARGGILAGAELLERSSKGLAP